MALVRSASGRRARIVVDVDAPAFSERWLTAVEAAQSR
jgi:hypothetical protein